MSKLIPFVKDIELTSADNKPIHHQARNEKGEMVQGARVTHSFLDFLCELTTAPGFAGSLKAWAAADLQASTRQTLNEQAPKAEEQGGFLVSDDVGKRFLDALDELDPSPAQRELLFNFVPFGRAVKAQTTPAACSVASAQPS